MVTIFYFQSKVDKKWVRCRDEEHCFQMDKWGYNVKMVTYEKEPSKKKGKEQEPREKNRWKEKPKKKPKQKSWHGGEGRKRRGGKRRGKRW